jgi:hypothetical protein
MHMLISILAALLGSLVGSAARGGVAMAQGRVSGESDAGEEPTINVGVSPVAGLIGGLVGSVLGLRAAFWAGSVLGAAGMDRLDARLLAQVGIDMDAMVAKAVDAADKARQAVTEQVGAGAESQAVEGSPEEPA